MTDLSKTSDRTISEASTDATFSQASGCGTTRSTWPIGETDLFGPVPVRANLSARQAKELGLLTSGTSGRTGTTSSASTALQSSLESRLRARTQTLGSTLYRMTWKEWATPSGRSRFRLRASVLRTSGTGSTGWPAPTATDALRCPSADFTTRNITLNHAAVLAGWATTSARDWHSASGSPEFLAERAEQTRGKPLSEQAFTLAGWPTCQARDGDSTGRTATPQTSLKRFEQGRRNLDEAVQLTVPARLTVSGELLTGCSAAMESGGQLNPAHSRWLMGLPAEWDDCGVMAMQSVRPRRRNSSKPSSKASHE